MRSIRPTATFGAAGLALLVAAALPSAAAAALADCPQTWPATSVADDFSRANTSSGLGPNWRGTRTVSSDNGILRLTSGAATRISGGTSSDTWTGPGGASTPQRFGGLSKRAVVGARIPRLNTGGGGWAGVGLWTSGVGTAAPKGYEAVVDQFRRISLRRYDGTGTPTTISAPVQPMAAPFPDGGRLGLSVQDGCVQVYVAASATAAMELQVAHLDNSYLGGFEAGVRGQLGSGYPSFDDFVAGQVSPGVVDIPLQTSVTADALLQSVGVNEKPGATGTSPGGAYDDTPYRDHAGTEQRIRDIGFRWARTLVPDTAARRAHVTSLGAQPGVKVVVNAPRPVDYGSQGNLDAFLATIAPVSQYVDAVGGANENDLRPGSGASSTLTTAEADEIIDQAVQLKQKIRDFAHSDPAVQARVRALKVMAAPLGNYENSRILKARYAARGISPTANVDLADVHIYSYPEPPSTNAPTALAMTRSLYPGRPVVVTETGYHNAETPAYEPGVGVSEAAAATYLTRTVFEYAAAGVTRLFFHELADLPVKATGFGFSYPSDRVRESEFGLYSAATATSWGAEKAAVPVLRSLMTRLAAYGTPPPAPPQRLLVNGVGIRHQLIRRAGGWALALWQDARIYDAQTNAAIAAPGRQALVILDDDRPITVRRVSTGVAAAPTASAALHLVQVPADDVLLIEYM